MNKIINCTGRDLNVMDRSTGVEGGYRVLKSDARAKVVAIYHDPIDVGGIEVKSVTISDPISGLPDPQEGVMYVVSQMVASSLGGTRDDLVTISPKHCEVIDGEQVVTRFVRTRNIIDFSKNP